MFKPEGVSLKIFKDRYAFTEDETWEDACKRVARQMSIAEKPDKQKIYENKFYEVLINNTFVPGGRIWYNSGRSNPQLLNCFVLDPNKDSKVGWGNTAKNVIVTSMTGGGCGEDFSDVRPRGSPISDQKGECPGPVELMKLVDACAKPVKAGGQRRVALMFSLDLDHPDVEEFLDAKLEKGMLTHANVSVRSKHTKEFIKAVKQDLDWELSWKGKYKKKIKARDLWNKIVKNAYNSAEPGFLNWELVENESNIFYLEDLVTTNPCITGDTKVALADGRTGITIKQLFEEGKDVPVYCLNNNNCVVIRMMRNPRITGHNKKIYSITLDDGTILKTTNNHSFRLKNNAYKKVEDLVPGESLLVMSKRQEPNPIKKDWRIQCNDIRQSEHRMIAEFTYDTKVESYHDVHHIDEDSYNHKIVSIDFIGYDTVYNGTVDEFHNFFIGEIEGVTSQRNYKKLNYFNNLNCGEIALSSFDCCCLGHIVLPRFVSDREIDYSFLGDTIRLAVRFLDNVLTVNSYPMSEMKDKSHKLRRIGLGTTGLADTLALLGYRYGSEEGNKIIDKLYRFISKAAYEASIMLAIEKDPFPSCIPDKHIESGYMKRMPQKIKSLIKEHGIRNCALLTQAPCGTVSILSGNCSSGIEPMYAPAYNRTYWKDNKRVKELVFHPLFEKFIKEGKSVDHFVSSHDLDLKDHMEVQRIIQKHIDNAVSKTINMSNDYPLEKMEKLWLEYLPHLKGTTFYREGTRGFINEEGIEEQPPLTPISLEEAKIRVKEEHSIDAQNVDDCPKGVCEI